jgi:peptidoglycan/xylan/chitin deacetylase (PgdA/CDA1 family)
MKNRLSILAIFIMLSLLAACGGAQPAAQTATADAQISAAVATQMAMTAHALTSTPVPTEVLPTAIPSPTTEVIQNPITATVWRSDPIATILLYHQYIPYDKTNSSAMKMQLSVFRTQLEQLEQAGFTSVSLEDWLKGNLQVPAGKRPLILTFDDLFYSNQIYLEADGTPSQHTGLGVMWQFNKDYPDFGFKPALFANMGDKLYGNVARGDWWYVEKGWQDSLAKVIAWCIENGAGVYNHFYDHPDLPKLDSGLIQWEMRKNDETIKEFLGRVGKDSLADNIENILSIPFDEWPSSKNGKNTILNYESLNGKPVLGIVDAEPHYVRKNLMIAPYVQGYNPYRIPRIEGQQENIDQLIKDLDYIPVAESCQINNPTPDSTKQPEYLKQQILQAVSTGRCSDGVYAVEGQLFRVQAGSVETITLPVYPKQFTVNGQTYP